MGVRAVNGKEGRARAHPSWSTSDLEGWGGDRHLQDGSLVLDS